MKKIRILRKKIARCKVLYKVYIKTCEKKKKHQNWAWASEAKKCGKILLE